MLIEVKISSKFFIYNNSLIVSESFKLSTGF